MKIQKYLLSHSVILSCALSLSCGNKVEPNTIEPGSKNDTLTKNSATENRESQICKLEGSIFVVTKGAGSYKLALSTVIAVEDTVYENIRNKVLSDVLDITEQKRLINVCSNSLSEYEKSFDYYSLISDVNENYDTALNQLDDIGKVDIEKKIITKKSSAISSASLDIYNQKCNKLLQVISTAKQSRDVNAENELKLVGVGVVDKLHILSKVISDIETIESGFIPSLAANKGDNVIAVQSDADGLFSLNLQQGKVYYIIARASRMYDEKDEIYEWIIKYTPPSNESDNIILANDNLLNKSIFNEHTEILKSRAKYLQHEFSEFHEDLSQYNINRFIEISEDQWTFDPPIANKSYESVTNKESALKNGIFITKKGDSYDLVDANKSIIGRIKLKEGGEGKVVEESSDYIYFKLEGKLFRHIKKQ